MHISGNRDGCSSISPSTRSPCHCFTYRRSGGLSWHTVRRAELDAIKRWDRTRTPSVLRMVGVDEKWLGRRHKRKEKFVTIVSDPESGVPIWIGYGRSSETLKGWLDTLKPEEKAQIRLFAMDMHEPFKKAVRDDPQLAHAAIVHDSFHIIKRAGEAVTELRRATFFRAGPELRAVGKGARWLVLRAWERSNDNQPARLKSLFRLNSKLARAYQLVEELRSVLAAPDGASLAAGLCRILRRTERRDNVPMRKWHDSLNAHFVEIVALGEHRPPTGHIEALNNNWETPRSRHRSASCWQPFPMALYDCEGSDRENMRSHCNGSGCFCTPSRRRLAPWTIGTPKLCITPTKPSSAARPVSRKNPSPTTTPAKGVSVPATKSRTLKKPRARPLG